MPKYTKALAPHPFSADMPLSDYILAGIKREQATMESNLNPVCFYYTLKQSWVIVTSDQYYEQQLALGYWLLSHGGVQHSAIPEL